LTFAQHAPRISKITPSVCIERSLKFGIFWE